MFLLFNYSSLLLLASLLMLQYCPWCFFCLLCCCWWLSCCLCSFCCCSACRQLWLTSLLLMAYLLLLRSSVPGVSIWFLVFLVSIWFPKKYSYTLDYRTSPIGVIILILLDYQNIEYLTSSISVGLNLSYYIVGYWTFRILSDAHLWKFCTRFCRMVFWPDVLWLLIMFIVSQLLTILLRIYYK